MITKPEVYGSVTGRDVARIALMFSLLVFAEEFLFRIMLFAMLAYLFGNVLMGGIVSVILFAAYHAAYKWTRIIDYAIELAVGVLVTIVFMVITYPFNLFAMVAARFLFAVVLIAIGWGKELEKPYNLVMRVF
jgi:membrane protease YdiL (CAAX protease family)